MLVRVCALCVALLVLAVPAAQAGVREDILRDCTDDDQLQGSYSPTALRDARANIPDDAGEYFSCQELIERALAATVGGRRSSAPGASGPGDTAGGSGRGGVSAGGGSAQGDTASPQGPSLAEVPPTPAEDEAVDAARERGVAPLEIGGARVEPGTNLATSLPRHSLPPSLVALLALLAACALAALVPAARRGLARRQRPQP